MRIDQLTGLRTILAAARADRPLEFSLAARRGERSRPCPFCEGNEESTPPEIWADRPGGGEPGTAGWRVRSVPNLYPALSDAERADDGGTAAMKPADPLRASARGSEPDLFSSVPARGSNEVIIHTPRHLTSLADLDSEQLGLAVAGWRERMRAHESASCVQLFVNEGGGAGASLEHTHAQLYALDFVPIAIARERERFAAYNQRTMGGELLAEIASEEVRRGERLVAIDDEAMVICPWASRSPFELRVLPRRAAASFERDEGAVAALGAGLRALRARFGKGLELNLWVRTAPRGTELFHWHIDIAPRLAVKAGFELATGVDTNIYAPERAAAELREALA